MLEEYRVLGDHNVLNVKFVEHVTNGSLVHSFIDTPIRGLPKRYFVLLYEFFFFNNL